MKHSKIAIHGRSLLLGPLLAASLLVISSPASAQVFRTVDATFLTIAGNNGTDATHTATISASSISSSYSLVLPASNALGALVNDGSGNLSWSTSSGGGTLSHITETYSNTTPYSSSAAGERLQTYGAASNIDLVLSPKGNGAIYSTLADNTATGGNLRGTNAVDWQMSRSTNSQVASGNFSTIAGGQNNTAGGTSSAIPGGQNLTLSNAGDFGFNSSANPMTVATSNISTFANTDLWLANNDNSARALVLYAPNNTTGAFPNGTKYVGLKAGAVTTSVTYTLPLADATSSGQVLYSDGAGTLNWGSYLPLAGGTLSTSTLATLLTLSSTTPAPATVLSMNGGRIVMQSTASTPASGSTIAANVAAVVVGDNGVTNSPATIALPSGTEGQILYITTQDPDGVTITTTVNSVSVNVTIATSEVGTFMYLGGQWRLQH
jgi:hypothetical protein